jgi:uncharacterized protein
MQARPLLTLGILALALAACASKPTQFHTLDPAPPANAAAGGSMALPIQLDSVTLPPELDRPELVRRSGPGSLDIADTDRWAGPLDQIARKVLATDLAERLPAGATVLPDDPAPPPKRRGLDVEIERFEGDLGGGVTLIAHWTLLDGSTEHTALHREEHIDIPAASADIGGTVAGMSRALGVLADRIAAAAR